ncbi:hypothetical protein ACHAXS_001822 [Conticribra weissflogii]
MFVDGVPFLTTTSRNIKFITVEHMPLQTTSQLKQSLARVIQLYARAGFVVQTILVDGQFEPLKNHLLNVVVNTTAASEHVGDVERCLRVIKERARAVVSGLPYQRLPKRILIELINFVVLWLNAFPAKNRIARNMSPRKIITRQPIDFTKHCKTEFGSYCEVYDDPTPSNTLTPRTQPAVCMGPTGNLQGTYKFFALRTGQVIKRRQFRTLPMPDSMIQTINNWERNEDHGELIFANRRGIPFTWNRQTVPKTRRQQQHTADFPAGAAELPGIAITQAEDAHATDAAEQEEAKALDVTVGTDLDREVPHMAFGQRDHALEEYETGDTDVVSLPPNANEQQLLNEVMNFSGTPSENNSVGELMHNLDHMQEEIDAEIEQLQMMDPISDETHLRRSSRATRGQRQSQRYDEEYELFVRHDNDERNITPMTELEITEHIMGVVFTQYSLRAGLRKFKERGEEALHQELKQLHDMDVFVPVPESSLSPQQKEKALSTVTFIKEKRDNRVKGRVCADGRKQRDEFSREEAASPTVTNESVFLTGVIDAKERLAHIFMLSTTMMFTWYYKANWPNSWI